MNQHQLLSVRKFALFCRELLHREAERERRLRGQNTICISTDAYCILATQPTLTFGFSMEQFSANNGNLRSESKATNIFFSGGHWPAMSKRFIVIRMCVSWFHYGQE